MTQDPNSPAGNRSAVSLYRFVSAMMSVVFAAVGLLFLFFSSEVLILFNRISDLIGIPHGPEHTTGFYLALAVSYMYLVSVIAFLMWRRPQEKILPMLLINGKAASSLVCVALILCDQPLLIYGTNAFVDGSIAAGVLVLYRISLRWSM